MTAINGKLGLDLNYVPSQDFAIILTSSEYRSPETGIQNIDWDWMKFHPEGFISGEDFDSCKQQFNSYLQENSTIVKSTIYKTGDISARMDVVPKALLAKVESSWYALIRGTKDLIQNQISTLNDIFKLNVLGAGLIAGSAIGLYYTKPEYKKTRIGLQALFIAGLASIVFAAFKANSSINLLQKL
jgi:hypothetical protein